MVDPTLVDYDGLIPNNVGLNADPRLRRALENWHPGCIDWWKQRGPEGFQANLVYLRTAISVEPEGWARFGYVRMPEYRWGILLAPALEDRRIGFGAHKDEPVWQEVPGEYRALLRRLIVVQGDTEPASVEQQRYLGRTLLRAQRVHLRVGVLHGNARMAFDELTEKDTATRQRIAARKVGVLEIVERVER